MNKTKKYFTLLLNIEYVMCLSVTKWLFSCVQTTNLNYINEGNKFSKIKSIFSKNILVAFQINIHFIERKNLVEFQWRKNQENIYFHINLIFLENLFHEPWNISKNQFENHVKLFKDVWLSLNKKEL
jgi:hypothetical protein